MIFTGSEMVARMEGREVMVVSLRRFTAKWKAEFAEAMAARFSALKATVLNLMDVELDHYALKVVKAEV